jgi:PAS domain S-box-containing protein
VSIHISRKQKLFTPITILATVLIFLGGAILYNSYQQIHTLQMLNEKVAFSTKIANAVHNLQKERGLSCGFVLDRNSSFRTKLTIQKKLTDTALLELQIFAKIHKETLSDEEHYIADTLKPLKNIRDLIQSNNLTYNEIIHSYTYMTDIFLQMITQLATQSHVPDITSHLLTYSNLLYMKEYRGIERALGVTVLSSKHTDMKLRILFTGILAMEEEKEKNILTYATETIRSFYRKQTDKPYFTQVKKMREQIIYHDKYRSYITPEIWYERITKTLEKLNHIGVYIQNETQQRIQKELSRIRKIFIIVNLLTGFSILIFIAMLITLAKLIEDERRLRLVTEKYIISSVTDLKGRIIDVSQAFCEISGYTKEEMIGCNHNIIRHPDMPKEVFRDLWSRIQNGQGWSGKVKNLKKDGGYYWVYAHIEPLYNTKGEVDSYISVRLDITESELLQEKVKEEEEKNRITQELMQQQSRLAQMGEMISMIAHQWRQPLTAITATTTTLQIKAKNNTLNQDKTIELAQKINNFSQHLSTTINDFRNFFKSTKNKQNTDFKTILNSVLNIIESTLKSNNITLTIEEKGALKSLYIYDNELKQVILNLIKNAEDALLEQEVDNPKIIIEIEGRILTVKDNAGGIPEEILPNIFDPYFSTKLEKDGTGLGLYMSKIIIEEHCEGRLTVENSTEGAVFKIIL